MVRLVERSAQRQCEDPLGLADSILIRPAVVAVLDGVRR